MNHTVYIVMWGEDCEGGCIEAVYDTEAKAVEHIRKNYPKWEEISPTERRRGCTFVVVEEWVVE